MHRHRLGLLGGIVIALMWCQLSFANTTAYKGIYDVMRQEGLNAIEQRQPFTLVFLSPHKSFYEVMKIRFKGEQSLIALRSYSPLGVLVEEEGFPVESYESFLDNFQKGNFFVMWIK